MASTQIDRLGIGGANTAFVIGVAEGVYFNTQMNQPFSFLLGGINTQVEYQATQSTANFSTDALVGGNAVPNGSTVYGANAVAGYANSASTATNTVGVYGQFRALANGVRGWGANFVTTDEGFAANLQGIEVDLNTSNAGSSSSGISVVSEFVVAPAASYAFVCQVHGFPFTWAFNSQDGAATVGLALGSLAASASSNSQPIVFNVRDSANAPHLALIQAIQVTGGASLYIAGTGVGSMVRIGSPLALDPFTIAAGANQLPGASGAYEGCIAFVTDFNGSPTYHGAIGAGGGSTGSPVYCDGAAWLTC